MTERPPKPQPRPLDAEALRRAALAYLERYSSSPAHLARILERRVRRAARLQPVDEAAARHWIEDAVAHCLKLGLVDDRRYAEGRTASLHRRGLSARAIAADLASKGVDRTIARAALDEADGALGYSARGGGDLAAAGHLARRRRLGPWRDAASRAAYRQRDLGSFARAGFSREVALKVLDCADPDDLDRLIREASATRPS